MIVLGADEGIERDKAVAARTILHHYRLAPARGQTLGKQTGCGIAGAASAKRQDEAHRPRRIGLRPCDVRQGRQRGSARGQIQEIAAGKFHFLNLPSNHSITSSAATSRLGGTVNPSAFAVFKLSTVSYFIGAWTGRSVGLAPLRMWST